MKLSQESAIGFVSILLWCLVSAAAYVFTGYIEESVDPSLLCFGVFLCAMLFFWLNSFKKISSIKIKCKNNIKNVFLVNVMTLGCWFLTIYPLKFIEPAIVNSVVLGVLPIVTLCAGFFLYNNKNTSGLDYSIALLLFIGILFLAVVCFKNQEASHYFTFQRIAIAFFSCIGGGFFLAVNNIYAKKLSDNGFSPFDILAVRFVLITFVTGILSYAELGGLHGFSVLLDIFIIAVTLIIVPQIIFQYALRELEPITISVIAPLMPVLVFFIEFYNKKLHPPHWAIMGVLYICMVSVVGAVARYRKIK